MLQITIPYREFIDERTNTFVYVKEQTIRLEHSLVSLAKWEAKWCIPFLSKTNKTKEQTIDYIRCMTLTQNVDPIVYGCLTMKDFKAVNEYIDTPMTATWFGPDRRNNARPRTKQITAELIYYWMIALNIPFECQKWHLNRLLTLIKVCNEESRQNSKTSKRDLMKRNAALNASRRKQMNTRG